MESQDRTEEVVLEKYRRLPPQEQKEVVDFMDFLAQRDRARGWMEFDAWAMDLARAKGFESLSEDDVARIVSDFRSAR